jgi:rhodanese-related sulfurtransferase
MSIEVGVNELAAAHGRGAIVIDVREPGEYAQGHVPGARLVPLGSLSGRYLDLPKGQPIYAICASGSRSLSAARWLRSQGIDCRSVRGGTSAWAGAGLPLATGRAEGRPATTTV